MHTPASSANSRIPIEVFRAALGTAAIVTVEILLGASLQLGWHPQCSYNDRSHAGLAKLGVAKTAPAVPAPAEARPPAQPRSASADASATVVVSPAPVTTVLASSSTSPASHASRAIVAQTAPARRAPEAAATPEALVRQIRSAQTGVCACGFRNGEAAALVFANDGRFSHVMGASGARGDCARAALASRVRSLPSRDGRTIPFVFHCLLR
jgi:hypothetical protein